LKFTIFYSWQSDLPNPINRGFIQGELEALAKEITAEGAVVVEVDRDTSGVAGSPDIGKTILAKIDAADAFVADLSIINSDAPQERKMPNPNVVFELGWAFKSLGENKVVTVMNTTFGGPEDLPFDLKQRRTVRYELPAGEDKAAARKALRDQLRAALKAIVEESRRSAAAPEPAPDRAGRVLVAIHDKRGSQDVEAKRLVEHLAEALDKLDPHALEGDQTDNLIKAIEASRPIVDDFGRVAQLAAAERSEDGVHGLVQGFEHLVNRYRPRGGGSYRNSDFDLFKFVGHEVAVVLIGHLIKAERWVLIRSVLAEEIPLAVDGEARTVRIDRLSAHSHLLTARSREANKISLHADLLKERHAPDAPAGGLAFDDLVAADLMLFLGTHDPQSEFTRWYPRSAAYLENRAPRFLSAATSQAGARNLATALGKKDLVTTKSDVTAALTFLKKALYQENIWFHWSFDPANIYAG
jgi:hypothetical protein